MMGVEYEHFLSVFPNITPPPTHLPHPQKTKKTKTCVLKSYYCIFSNSEMSSSSLAAGKVALFHWVNAVDSCKFWVLYIKDLEVP